MEKKNRHSFAENDGLNTQGNFIKSATAWLVRWADPIGWALLALVAIFAGRVWA